MKAPDEMPIKQLFEKVFIKSESDLPKIEDVYYIHLKSDNKVVEWCFYVGENNQEWLKHIDWYLQPIEQPAEKELRDKISDAFLENSSDANNGQMSVITEDSYSDLIDEILYLIQSSPAMSPKPMDDVIGGLMIFTR